jgi:hypothetical protein
VAAAWKPCSDWASAGIDASRSTKGAARFE